MCDLAEQAQLSRSGLTRLVDRLEREGLRQRCSCDHDARGAYACLTDAGRERLEAARGTHLAVVRQQFLSHFTRPSWTSWPTCGSGSLPATATRRPDPPAGAAPVAPACGRRRGSAAPTPAAGRLPAVAPVPADHADHRDQEGDQAPQTEGLEGVAGGAAEEVGDRADPSPSRCRRARSRTRTSARACGWRPPATRPTRAGRGRSVRRRPPSGRGVRRTARPWRAPAARCR